MSAPRSSGRATSSCHACGNPVAVADAYARIAIGGATFLLCCPICLSSVEAGRVQRLLVPSSFSELARMESHNMPVGLFDNDILGPVLERSFPLRGNDRLMLFTDGLLELQERSGEELGREGVERLFTESVQTPLDGGAWNPLSQLRSLHGRSRNDDVLAVLARVKAT